MEQSTTFVHAQSDTHGYTLLPEPGVAGEVSLCVRRNHPLLMPHGPSSPSVGILAQKSKAGRDASGKKIYCVWNWWIASYFTQHRKAYCFFSLVKVQVLLTYHLLFYFHPCQIPFLMSNQPAPPWDTGKMWGWFSLYETEKLALLEQLGHSCQFLFIISSTQLDVWNSQTLGETHVCLNFKSRLLAGNEYPATVAQLCLLKKSKSNPSGC